MSEGVRGGCARGAEESVRGEARQLPHVMILPQVSNELTLKRQHALSPSRHGNAEIREPSMYTRTHCGWKESSEA